MAKLPRQPDHAYLEQLTPEIRKIPAGTALARVYFRGGQHPVRWHTPRYFGPMASARFDHHRPDENGKPRLQRRGVLYCALAHSRFGGLDVGLAEVFQRTRIVHTTRHDPAWAIFRSRHELRLLDLTGPFPTLAGASQALMSGPRASARAWARAFHEVYAELHGLIYRSSMSGDGLAIALNERAVGAGALPRSPELNLQLSEPRIRRMVTNAASRVGYALIPPLRSG